MPPHGSSGYIIFRIPAKTWDIICRSTRLKPSPTSQRVLPTESGVARPVSPISAIVGWRDKEMQRGHSDLRPTSRKVGGNSHPTRLPFALPKPPNRRRRIRMTPLHFRGAIPLGDLAFWLSSLVFATPPSLTCPNRLAGAPGQRDLFSRRSKNPGFCAVIIHVIGNETNARIYEIAFIGLNFWFVIALGSELRIDPVPQSA